MRGARLSREVLVHQLLFFSSFPFFSFSKPPFSTIEAAVITKLLRYSQTCGDGTHACRDPEHTREHNSILPLHSLMLLSFLQGSPEQPSASSRRPRPRDTHLKPGQGHSPQAWPGTWAGDGSGLHVFTGVFSGGTPCELGENMQAQEIAHLTIGQCPRGKSNPESSCCSVSPSN